MNGSLAISSLVSMSAASASAVASAIAAVSRDALISGHSVSPDDLKLNTLCQASVATYAVVFRVAHRLRCQRSRLPGSMQDNPALTLFIHSLRLGVVKSTVVGPTMKLDLQYIDHPNGGERLVILPESQYRILALAAADALTATARHQRPAPSLPMALLQAISDGEIRFAR